MVRREWGEVWAGALGTEAWRRLRIWRWRRPKCDVEAKMGVLSAGGCVDEREWARGVGRTRGEGSERVERRRSRDGKSGSKMKRRVLECGWEDIVGGLLSPKLGAITIEGSTAPAVELDVPEGIRAPWALPA